MAPSICCVLCYGDRQSHVAHDRLALSSVVFPYALFLHVARVNSVAPDINYTLLLHRCVCCSDLHTLVYDMVLGFCGTQ